MFLIAGIVLLAMGVASGAALIAAPLGWLALTPRWPFWVAFPLCCVASYALFLLQGSHFNKLNRVFSNLLLPLAWLAAAALLLLATSVLHSNGSTSALWYVLIVAGLAGALLRPTPAKPPAAAPPSPPTT